MKVLVKGSSVSLPSRCQISCDIIVIICGEIH